MGALGATLDAGSMVVPDSGHRARCVVGLLRTRLGRLVVLGSGRKCVLHAMAGRNRIAAFVDHRGKARRLENLDDPAGHSDLLAQFDWYLSGALGRVDVSARLRHRP